MNSIYVDIIKKVKWAIIKNGIPMYVNQWQPPTPPDRLESDDDLCRYLSLLVKAYHSHSFIICHLSNAAQLENNPMPKCKWDKLNRIGTIIFYHFYGNEKKDYMIKLVRHQINQWKKHHIAGLIIDLRKHYGGNMYPAIESLVDILGKTTLFAFSNTPALFDNHVWLTLDQTIKPNRKFLTADIAFRHPIAIIVSRHTGSSGEFVACCFYGRPNVKIFGYNTDKTAGYLSANMGININNDIELVLTVNLTTTVDGIFHDDERLTVDMRTKKPITEAKKWILDV